MTPRRIQFLHVARNRTLHASAVLLATALAGACGEGEPTVTATIERTVTLGSRDVATAERLTISSGIVLTGSLNPYQEVEVRAQVPGVVSGLRVDRGQSVRRGQRLATIEAQGIRSQAASADAQIAGAESNLALARRRFESAEMLFKREAVSELDYQTARSQLEAAEAQLAATRAQAASARENAARTTIEAPIGGQISSRSVSEGEAVQPGQTLFTVVNTEYLELAGQVPVDKSINVRVGQPVEFTLDAYPGQTFRGSVARIDPTADPGTRQVGVFVRLPNQSRRLVGGLFATGRILTGTEREAIAVPVDAIRGTADERFVWTVNNNVLRRVPVQIGDRDEAKGVVEVVSGLAAGATVVIGPGEMNEGARVTISSPQSGAPAPPSRGEET